MLTNLSIASLLGYGYDISVFVFLHLLTYQWGKGLKAHQDANALLSVSTTCFPESKFVRIKCIYILHKYVSIAKTIYQNRIIFI